MTMKLRILWCMAAGLLVSAPVLAADSVKIGYVDVRAVVLESKAGQQHKKEMDKLVLDKQANLKKEEEKLKALQQSLEKEMLTLTEAQKQEKQRGFQEKVQAFQKSVQDDEREVRQKDTEYTNKAIEDIRKIIADVAKDQKAGLVLGKNEVLFAEDGMDLTPKVIQKYDSLAPAKK
jgi:outer membrane protein